MSSGPPDFISSVIPPLPPSLGSTLLYRHSTILDVLSRLLPPPHCSARDHTTRTGRCRTPARFLHPQFCALPQSPASAPPNTKHPPPHSPPSLAPTCDGAIPWYVVLEYTGRTAARDNALRELAIQHGGIVDRPHELTTTSRI